MSFKQVRFRFWQSPCATTLRCSSTVETTENSWAESRYELASVFWKLRGLSFRPLTDIATWFLRTWRKCGSRDQRLPKEKVDWPTKHEFLNLIRWPAGKPRSIHLKNVPPRGLRHYRPQEPARSCQVVNWLAHINKLLIPVTQSIPAVLR